MKPIQNGTPDAAALLGKVADARRTFRALGPLRDALRHYLLAAAEVAAIIPGETVDNLVDRLGDLVGQDVDERNRPDTIRGALSQAVAGTADLARAAGGDATVAEWLDHIFEILDDDAQDDEPEAVG